MGFFAAISPYCLLILVYLFCITWELTNFFKEIASTGFFSTLKECVNIIVLSEEIQYKIIDMQEQ